MRGARLEFCGLLTASRLYSRRRALTITCHVLQPALARPTSHAEADEYKQRAGRQRPPKAAAGPSSTPNDQCGTGFEHHCPEDQVEIVGVQPPVVAPDSRAPAAEPGYGPSFID